MTFLKLVQQELKTKKRLLRAEVYDLAYKYGRDFDTLRRNLEPDKTPFSKPVKIGNRIKWWDYVPEAIVELHKPIIASLEQETINTQSDLNNALEALKTKFKINWNNRDIFKELNQAIQNKNDYVKQTTLKKFA